MNVTLILLRVVWLFQLAPGREVATVQRKPAPTLKALLNLSPDDLAKIDIARMNLLCAEGLTGEQSVALESRLAQLDAWAQCIRAETDRHAYRFKRNPAEFEGSEGLFKVLLMGVVLAEDFGVCYRPDLRAGPELANVEDDFFADPRAVFLTGLLGDERQGTCSSMPVLYVAVGRRLGYPLKLVTTKGHLFVHWEGSGEEFNVEVTGQGINRFPNEYYRRWPFTVTDEEVKAEGYLESLSPEQELAVFLSVRAMCLRQAGRMTEAAEAFTAAARLAPKVVSYRVMAIQCREESNRQGDVLNISKGFP